MAVRAGQCPTTLGSTRWQEIAPARTAEDLIRESHDLLERCGLVRSATWVTRTVRIWLRSPVVGMPFGNYLLARVQLNAQERRAIRNDPELRYLLSYADPTGEAAVRHVLATAGDRVG